MGVLVLLVANENPAAEVRPAVARELAALGVTSLSLLRDDQTTAVALEGWAFADRSAEAAARGRRRPCCRQSAAPDRRVGAPRRLQIANNKEDKVKRLLILAATLAAALSVGVATAGAAPETPNGYCGAANMLNAWPGGGANVPNSGGMQNAMTVNNANGNNGMFGAVGTTAC